MKRLALALLLGAAIPLAALEVPPPPTQWVTDRAGLLGGTEADLLNRKLSDFEQASGAQFIVYTFPSLEGEDVFDFAMRCVEKWKVGQKKYDNGLVLFVFKNDRKVRIQVGYGLEGTITDAFSTRVISEYMRPYFQKEDYAGGLIAGVDAIIAKIRKEEAPVPPLNPRGSGQQEPVEDINPVVILIIVFVVFFVIVPMITRRRSGCSGCIFPMFPGGGTTFGGGGFGSGGGFSGGGFGGGGFSGGGGGFGGGGATGSW